MPLNIPSVVATNSGLKKTTLIEYTGTVGAGQVVTGQWHDSNVDGTMYVIVSAFSNQAGSASSFLLQETEDSTNPNFVRTVTTVSATAASTLSRAMGTIKARYWRFTWTQSVTAGTLEITTTALNFVLPTIEPVQNSVTRTADAVPIFSNGVATNQADNTTFCVALTGSNAVNQVPLWVAPAVYGGAFSGTTNATRVGWTKTRTPTVYNTASATASGDTVVWTPAANNKFRLLKYQIEVTSNASLAAGAILVITLRDNVTDTLLTHSVFVPTTAVTTGGPPLYVSEWQDLGQYGYLSAAANNALNINLATALATGAVRIRVAGTEE